MPFVTLIEKSVSEGNTAPAEMNIAMFPSAPGLLLDSIRIWFYDEECKLTLHYLD